MEGLFTLLAVSGGVTLGLLAGGLQDTTFEGGLVTLVEAIWAYVVGTSLFRADLRVPSMVSLTSARMLL